MRYLLKMDLKETLNKLIEEEFNRAEYLKWKRKNVSYRGMNDTTQENGGSAVLGNGLYTAALSNKSMAKSYGELYYVVNGIPKKPKVFNNLNEWEVWFQNNLVMKFSKGKFPDKREFFAVTTIENEMMNLGYDGVIIKGREYVAYKPENVKYYRNEDQLIDAYERMYNTPLSETLNKIIAEELGTVDKPFYHGTRTVLPFEHFDPKMIGTGIVSSGRPEYGGFFFTDSRENAEFYTEWFIATVKIAGLIPVESKNPPQLMKQAVVDHKNYLVTDVLDGAMYSDIAVVPSSNVNTITIVSWEFEGDEESYFEHLDEIFGNGDEDDYINQDMIKDTLSMIQMDINYLLRIPIFKQYFDSKV